MTEGTKGTILYAEDNSGTRRSVKRFLDRKFPEFVIEPLDDGTSLEERLKGELGDVRLVITDNDMPGIKGSQIIDQYAQMDGFSHIPFILLYGGDKSTGEFLADKYGNVFYLLKPPEMGHLEEFIREKLLAYSEGRAIQS
jgi:DNA-binding NtrC family response regulator